MNFHYCGFLQVFLERLLDLHRDIGFRSMRKCRFISVQPNVRLCNFLSHFAEVIFFKGMLVDWDEQKQP